MSHDFISAQNLLFVLLFGLLGVGNGARNRKLWPADCGWIHSNEHGV